LGHSNDCMAVPLRGYTASNFAGAAYYLFPTLDGWRRAGGGTFGWDMEGWHQFMDWAGISSTVLYPTVGLGYGVAKEPEWAADLARVYNDYVYN
jgi:hypothetical protein